MCPSAQIDLVEPVISVRMSDQNARGVGKKYLKPVFEALKRGCNTDVCIAAQAGDPTPVSRLRRRLPDIGDSVVSYVPRRRGPTRDNSHVLSYVSNKGTSCSMQAPCARS